ncbi:MAG: Mut7-C RNAse domain-containing protein [Thermodesulfobacteriota bacterium]
MDKELKFFADSMLGKLTLWLKIVGHDVAYERTIDDTELIRRAGAEGRVVLTRDTLLIKRRWVREEKNHLFIESDSFREQLKQVVEAYGLDRERFLTRCLRCNLLLEDIEKGSIEGRVPPYVYSTQEEFSTCPSCGRLYWAGTHRERMERELAEDDFKGP